MSQAKVDRYKEEKANRQKIMAKEKRQKRMWKIGGWALVVVCVCWIGGSAYSKFHVPVRAEYEINTTAMDDYLNSLVAEE